MQHQSTFSPSFPIQKSLENSISNWTTTVAWAPFDHACTYRLSNPNGATRYLKMVQRAILGLQMNWNVCNGLKLFYQFP